MARRDWEPPDSDSERARPPELDEPEWDHDPPDQGLRSRRPAEYSLPYDRWSPEEYVFYEGQGYHRGFFDPFAVSRPPRQGRPLGRYSGRGPRGYRRPDDRIREEVSERLRRDGDVDATEIEVLVQNGEITLEGTVTDREQKRWAEDLALDVRGVRDVQNRLRVLWRESSSDGSDRRLRPDVQVRGSDSHSGSGFLTERGDPRSRRAAGRPRGRQR